MALLAPLRRSVLAGMTKEGRVSFLRALKGNGIPWGSSSWDGANVAHTVGSSVFLPRVPGEPRSEYVLCAEKVELESLARVLSAWARRPAELKSVPRLVECDPFTLALAGMPVQLDEPTVYLRVRQLILPDPAGRYPGETGYAWAKQPLLPRLDRRKWMLNDDDGTARALDPS